MDTAHHWPQEMVVKPIEEIVVTSTCPKPAARAAAGLERKAARPQKEQAAAALNCPRCNSTNTKFCYYNNYSLTQPRYFCKTCRRYWTEGGSLRNIPVGGGSRKNKRSSSSSSSSNMKLPDHLLTHHHHGQDLNLSFPAAATTTQGFMSIVSDQSLQVSNSNNNNHNIESSNRNNHKNFQVPIASSTEAATITSSRHHQQQEQLSALELLTGISSSRGMNSFLPDPGTVYAPAAGFASMQDFKPTLSFSLDGLGYGSLQHHQSVSSSVVDGDNDGRLLFPFEDLKQVSTTTDQHLDQSRGHGGDSSGYWTGMLGGGSW